MKTANFKLKIRGEYIYINVDTLRLLDSSGEVTGNDHYFARCISIKGCYKANSDHPNVTVLSELAAGVAHHVRTPLTTISGYLQIMLGRLQDDQYTVRRVMY